ncbi:unnamed protein product [Brassicogethes aeneus]|uniref:DNA/RNA-binding domain-containing protein n=1 Tax=Brassicogethes aeneus TaxID=1431903 RepID=A0A9P0FIT1_BRAAE|nr:unnamed protein product [Brassicogethes aeneus]
MAGVNESKKELGSEFTSTERRNMNRGKPQQALYRPGSGPLRKSNIGLEDLNESTENNSRQNTPKPYPMSNEDAKYRSESSSPRENNSFSSRLGGRHKKPEQQLYVPKPVAQARETASSQDYDRGGYNQNNGNESNYERDRFGNNRSKRYSNRRKDNMEYQDEWRDKNRQIRQGSEPRGMANGSQWQRQRDTRSVDPCPPPGRNYSEKMQAKPPSGRRHSTIGLEQDKRPKTNLNINNLAPRFQKKLLLEGKQINQPPPLEENWDGSSVTFQGTSNPPTNYLKNPSYHPMGSYHHQMHQQMPHAGYHTLPNRARGRGRLQDFSHMPGDSYRSMTPEIGRSPCNSRPPTPPLSRPHTPVNYPSKNDDYRYNNYNYDDRQRKNTNISDRLKVDRQHRPSEDRDTNTNKWDYDNRRNQDNRRQHKRDRDRGDRREPGARTNYDRNRKPTQERRDYNNRPNKDECSRGDFSSNSYRNDNRNYESTTKVNENPETKAKFNDSLNAQLSPVSPESSDELKTTYIPFVNPMSTLQEALSDVLTRSSSISSLVDASAKSMPPNIDAPHSGRKKRKDRRKSKQRNDSRPRDGSGSRSSSFRHQRRDSISSVDNNFKVAEGAPRTSRHRRGSRDRRDSSHEGFRGRGEQPQQSGENWRAEIRSRQNSETKIGDRSRSNSEREEVKLDVKKAGVIVLPQQKPEPPKLAEQPRYPDTRKNSPQQKSLFDPNNPNKPIIVRSQSTRVSVPGIPESNDPNQSQGAEDTRPSWYEENSPEFKSCHFPDVIRDIKKADVELQYIIATNMVLNSWESVEKLRQFLKDALKYLLYKDLKFCETENVEQHLWKILYYSIIEVARKAIAEDPSQKDEYKVFILFLIDEGNKFFEELLEDLQENNKFQLSSFLGSNNCEQKKGLGYVGLALNSAQKIFIFLGDLGRYREQRRRLDAVYYFMRSLMSSNPAPSARQSMVSLFYEIRKKYEQGEKKRREERLERARLQMKQKESEETTTTPGSLRKETWIRPDGGKRVHRTTQALQDNKDSEEEDLASLGNIELNKRFVTTYLHVLGKLYTKIGMETFQESAIQMLKELRALLHHTPVPMPSNRLLMLLALNMFAIESTQLKDVLDEK